MVPFSLSVTNCSSSCASFYYKENKDSAPGNQLVTHNDAINQVGGIKTHFKEGYRILGEYR